MGPTFADIIDVVQDYEPVHLLTSSQSEQAAAARFLNDCEVPTTNITWHIIPVDNAWMLDNGPVYVTNGASTLWNAGGGIHCVTNDQPVVRTHIRRSTGRVVPR